MSTIKDKIRFNYDGKWSDEYGLMHVVLDSGMYDEQMVATRTIVETEVRGSTKPLLHDVQEEPLSFEMTIAFKSTFSESDIDGIIRWLFGKRYKPLYFEGKEDKIYMCMPVDTPNIVHNGLKQGYFTIQMRCDSSHLYSSYKTSPLTTVTTESIITLNSNGHYEIFPEISIMKIGEGHITIESLDDGGSIFEIRDLTNLEDIYINCEKEIVETDIVGEYRYDNIIGEFPKLLYGQNRFKVIGACEIQFRYKDRYKL